MCKLILVNIEKKDRPGCYARAVRILTVEDINELKKVCPCKTIGNHRRILHYNQEQ
jgi:hypothetical protein